jgi:hypothetical protein
MYFSFSVKDVSDEGNIREENELAKTGGNTADGEEKTNIVSCHHDEQEQVVKESTIATCERFINCGVIIPKKTCTISSHNKKRQ